MSDLFMRQTLNMSEIRKSTKDNTNGAVQWTTVDEVTFFPQSHTVKELVPGCYDIMHTQAGVHFMKFDSKDESLIKFPDSSFTKIIDDISKFWELREKYKQFNVTHRRGYLLWGLPGCGKSAIIRQSIDEVVSMGGISVRMGDPYWFVQGLRLLRKIQPDVKIVATLEDIEETIEMYGEHDILSVLDGAEKIDNIVYLASTNYPEKLGGRIINRPSRFDRRYKIGKPDSACRKYYLEDMCKQNRLQIDVEKWLKDTKEMSLAHLKELFVAVNIGGDPYDEVLNLLKDMMDTDISSDDDDSKMGFCSFKDKK